MARWSVVVPVDLSNILPTQSHLAPSEGTKPSECMPSIHFESSAQLSKAKFTIKRFDGDQRQHQVVLLKKIG